LKKRHYKYIAPREYLLNQPTHTTLIICCFTIPFELVQACIFVLAVALLSALNEGSKVSPLVKSALISTSGQGIGGQAKWVVRA
jgi:hypothetical protein